jgi:hypothetical protein
VDSVIWTSLKDRLLAVFFNHSEFRTEIYEFKIDVRSQPLRLLSAAPAQLLRRLYSHGRQGLRRDGGFEIAARGFRRPEDARWNAERQAVELGIEIGEYSGWCGFHGGNLGQSAETRRLQIHRQFPTLRC